MAYSSFALHLGRRGRGGGGGGIGFFTARQDGMGFYRNRRLPSVAHIKLQLGGISCVEMSRLA